MYVSGVISKDYNGFAKVGENSFTNIMYDFARHTTGALAYYYEENLGGHAAIIPKCNIVMYFSKKEMSFEDAQINFLNTMFSGSGDFELKIDNIGYSEWTIIGYDLEKMHLGGHNLNDILLSHLGEYVNIRIETLEERDGRYYNEVY